MSGSVIDPRNGFHPIPNNSYLMISAKNPSFALQVIGNGYLTVGKLQGGLNQQWKFFINNDGSFSIRSVLSGGTMEIPDTSTYVMKVFPYVLVN